MQTDQQLSGAIHSSRSKERDKAASALKRRFRVVAAVTFHYVLLFGLSFVFIYPMLYMFSKSLMTPADLTDASVQWLPKKLSFFNYEYAFEELVFVKSFFNSMVTSLIPALIQILSCAIAGYGLARYRFPGYTLLLGMVLFSFLVPPQTIVVPLYMLFSDMNWINTYLPYIVPPLFGHGLRGALFVLIFMQFFRGLPYQMEEAARIDGASAFRTFWSIMMPLARPAMLVVFLFSLVWHWNDLFQPSLYTMLNENFNLTQYLSIMDGKGEQELSQGLGGAASDLVGLAPTFQNRVMAGALMTILPMLLLYLFTQRYFVEGVERAGIAGE